MATYRKLFTFTNNSTHSIVLLSSGNLATTQALVEQLSRLCHKPNRRPSFELPSMFDIALPRGQKLVGLSQEGSEISATKA